MEEYTFKHYIPIDENNPDGKLNVTKVEIPRKVVRKTLKLTAKTSDATEEEKHIMQDESTSLEKKIKICEKRVKFENFTDYNDLQWGFESRKFVDGHADDDFLFCEAELVATTTVEDEKSFLNALKPMQSLTTFGDSLQLVDILEKIDDSSFTNKSGKRAKSLIISGVILFILFLMALAARTACRKPQMKQLKAEKHFVPRKTISTAGTNDTAQTV
ncbi:hypothetical protein SNEBB_010591 [Seison nebaliae]|nr:hypothetical protein SNEBB_010591 [Seison nebaliae]